ncbi:MAG: glycosyltransferase family 4 protein [Armatimonadetes bacterium]|nr:glycosyltransferase family 4 protein [Armatimonadota bacterium]
MAQAGGQLRILQVLTPHRLAGAERVCAQLSAALKARGHEVKILMPARVPELAEYARSLGVEVVYANIGGKLNPWAAGRIAAAAQAFGADLLHTHLSSASWHGCRAGRQAGLPVLAHVHAMSSALWYGGADRIVACSHGVQEHLRRAGLTRIPLEVVYNGVLVDEAAARRPPEEVGQELSLGGGPIIACMASLTARKGQLYLIEALARLRQRWPGLRCLFLGEGPLRRRLQRRAAALGLQDMVHFLGFREDRFDVLQLCELTVLPSIGIEGFGLAVIEAALLGLPTVASDLPGLNEAVLDGETGLLVPPRDPEALATAIGRLLSNVELRRNLGVQARRRARADFTIERMAERIEEVYARLLARAHERRQKNTQAPLQGDQEVPEI